MTNRAEISASRRWVVKVGSALLTDDGRGLDENMIRTLVAQLAQLRASGCEVVLVSSGAVAAGIVRLGMSARPQLLHELQAAAAAGQSVLVQAYENAFAEHDIISAQVLLGHDDIIARDRYLNARGTLKTLLGLGVVPVVNENDTVVTDEIRFGDNDTLGALVANLIDADALLLLTDQQGLYREDPRQNPAAELVQSSDVNAPELDAMAGEGGALGRGGMVTKLRAARVAARSGTETVIAGGRVEDVIARVTAGDNIGTWLRTGKQPQNARKQWLASMVQVRGSLALDDGAVRVLRESGRSLLPVGVRGVQGDFQRGDMVSCRDSENREIARGLVNYSAVETRQIMGSASSEIEGILGYTGGEELVHRDNLVIN
ncbi:glutamate 5-kinase [Halioglobus japonicus]|uniref:Glutamate 5-kinase n=1 Tax=Halioglobus japonicus TaxID=930805 RepID=A0AAP8MDY8_9GAMM|nr:glutamate 5-kinase [Halioglobus japonicus]AQA17818.1 glutamate 5-kinase [Halioglobus japonicus]PLW85777.1 glutamate 5-kinase [Halioglobus japonicus]GHD17455.1 glutamate 5-kinase [Halioglobus japonicus]